MNIFLLDTDPKKCAEYHCDKHVVKMITETAQMLCTVNFFCDMDVPYNPTHLNHPCTIWAGESLNNWIWLKEFGLDLYDEYQYRYGCKTHKAGEVIYNLTNPPLIKKGLTQFAQAMPDIYKDKDPVEAYRNYYVGEKSHLFKWTKREVPFWIQQRKSWFYNPDISKQITETARKIFSGV